MSLQKNPALDFLTHIQQIYIAKSIVIVSYVCIYILIYVLTHPAYQIVRTLMGIMCAIGLLPFVRVELTH